MSVIFSHTSWDKMLRELPAADVEALAKAVRNRQLQLRREFAQRIVDAEFRRTVRLTLYTQSPCSPPKAFMAITPSLSSLRDGQVFTWSLEGGRTFSVVGVDVTLGPPGDTGERVSLT